MYMCVCVCACVCVCVCVCLRCSKTLDNDGHQVKDFCSKDILIFDNFR